MEKNDEYQQELQTSQQIDIPYSSVSASRFLFYLVLACFLALSAGCAYTLYTKRFHKTDVHVQESTLYVPKYR